MKIDFILSSLTGGGAERVLAILANYFANKSHTIRIITFNEGDAYTLENNIIRIKLHDGNIKNHKIRSLKNLYSFYHPKNNRPDVMISFITQTNFIAIIIAKIFSIKIIVSEHNSYLRAQNPKYLTHFTRRFLYPLANYLTVLTKFDIDYYKRKGVKVIVMPNPCSFDILNQSISSRQKTILAVGNLNRYYHKGFDNLINFISPILKNHKEWQLKIVGSGEKGLRLLMDLTKKNNIESQVTFTGFRNDVNLLMQDSEIFVLSSRFEGLPMVLLEAMSQGMACIAFDCKTGPGDIIEHNINGLLIDDQNMNAMQLNLENLIIDKQFREEIGSAALRSIDKFSIENIGKKWENLFREMKIPF